jgi:hypothetical protein
MVRALSLLFVLVAAGTAAAQPVELSLRVSPTAGSLADEFVATVQMTIKGVNGPDRYTPPDFGDGFRVVDSGRQQSTQWSYDPQRGQEIRNVEVRRYRLQATRAGKHKIGEAKVILDGVEYGSKPTVVEVVDSGVSLPSTPQGNPGANLPPDATNEATFLHVVADRPKVFYGEQVTVTWLLYTRSDVLKFEPKPPRLDGVWAETLYEPQKYLTYHEEVVGGREYAVAVISRKALFPTRAGEITIPPYAADVATLYTSFASPLHLASNKLVLQVDPLPPGAPAGFDPAYVGSFAVETSIDRDSVPAGDSLSLLLTVRGTGPIRRARIPSLTLEGFNVVAPREFDERVDTDTDKVKGERKYKYLLTPTKGGKLEVGPVEIAYFDPTAKKYEIARAEPILVNVIGDPAAIASKLAGQGGEEDDNLISRDIRPPHILPAVTSRLVARFYNSRVFLGVLAAPALLFVLIVVGDRLRARLRRETPRARLRRARGRARKRMRVAELHIKGNRASKFFGELARVLTEHIEERVGEPVSAMTRDRLRDFLGQRGFPEETVEALVRELENCDFARFAPSASGPGEMRAAMRRVRALLAAIERVRPVQKEALAS